MLRITQLKLTIDQPIEALREVIRKKLNCDSDDFTYTPYKESIDARQRGNDFIFSYLANAMGFVGAVTVLLLLLGISVRILLAALQSTDALGRYLCVGIFAALFWQCIINLGMNLQVLPVIGVTLPFFSAGGSSVVMVYLCVGLVLAVSRKNRRKKLAVPIELEQV